MDKIDKFLCKVDKNEYAKIMRAISDVLEHKTSSYDVRKLRGHQDVYRIRIGSTRIIFRQLTDDIEVLDIGRRSEKTYRQF
jgi:mRNA-degrading endonuclease RelE of RelBE toxin-antitoxin system